MRITIGNDELILHIRKNYRNCRVTTSELGKRIYHWIAQTDPNAVIQEHDARCYWGDTGIFIGEDKLPKTAAQITFDANLLPGLYAFLGELGKQEI